MTQTAEDILDRDRPAAWSGAKETFEAVRPAACEAPHRTAGDTYAEILRAWLIAACFVGAWGVFFFGRAALVILAVSVLSAVGSAIVCGRLLRRDIGGGSVYAAVVGLLVGLTLPATAPVYVAAIGSIVAIAIGTALFGGVGHYRWNPVLVGRVVVQFLFASAIVGHGPMMQGAVLSPGRLLVGRLSAGQPMESGAYPGWSEVALPVGRDAVIIERPVSALRRFGDGRIKPEDGLVLTPLLRDALPPWRDSLLGAVPGGIGETPVLALIIAGLFLIYRGYLRWQLPAAMLAAAALAAAVLPVESGAAEGGYYWLPALAVENGSAVGLAYVLHHLTAGELLLAAFLLAGESVTSPLRARGQAVFGAAIGAMTIFMRLYGLVACEAYWAILILNTFVPLIDRSMRRPIVGLAQPEA